MRGWRAWARPHGDSAARRLCVNPALPSNRTAIFAVLNGRPLQSDHALLPTFFSLLPTLRQIIIRRPACNLRKDGHFMPHR